MLTVIFVLIAVAFLFGAGAVPSRLLFSEEASRLRLAVTPVLGFGLLVIAVQTLYLLGLTVRRQAPFVAVAILGLWVADRWWLARRQSATGNPEQRLKLTILGFGAAAVVLVGWPGFVAGYRTYMAYANPDANNYQFMADRYLNHPLSEQIALDGYHPGNYFVNLDFQSHMRSGVEAYLAWVSAVCETTTKQAYWIAVCSMVFLIPLSAYVFVVLGLNADRRVGLIASALMATSSLVGLLAFQELLGNLGGAAVLPAALGCILACIRKVSIRNSVAAAVLCAALLSLYPEMLGLLGPAAVGAIVLLAWRQNTVQILRNSVICGASTLAGALVVNPVFGYYGIQMALRQASARAGGESYAFAFTKSILPVAFGLLPFPLDSLGGGPIVLALRVFAYIAGAICVFSLGVYAFRGRQDEVRIPLLGAFGAMLALAAYIDFRLHYSYGFFKVFLYGEFLIIAVLAAFGFALWNGNGQSRSQMAKWGGATLLLAVAGCNFASLAWYGAVSLSGQQHGIVNAVGLSLDPSFNELEELRHIVAPADSVMLDTQSGILEMWAAYGLRDLKVSLMRTLLYFQSWQDTDFVHGYSDRYVLVESGGGSDIVERRPNNAPLWRSPRFELYDFRAYRDYVTLGSNWYGLDNGTYPYRWLNNDGEILLIHPSERRYRIAFQCSPGPGVPGPLRHLRVLVNDATVYEQVTDGPSYVTSNLFTVDGAVNRIKLSIAEKAGNIPIDTRLLNVSIAKVNITGEHAEEKMADDENPIEITARDLPKYAKTMTGFFADTWVGPKAQLVLSGRGDPRQFEIEGEVPVWAPFAAPLQIGVSVNGIHLGEIVAAKGKFRGSVLLPPGIRKQSRLLVSLVSNQFLTGQQVSHNGDTRPLSFFFRAARLTFEGALGQ